MQEDFLLIVCSAGVNGTLLNVVPYLPSLHCSQTQAVRDAMPLLSAAEVSPVRCMCIGSVEVSSFPCHSHVPPVSKLFQHAGKAGRVGHMQ